MRLEDIKKIEEVYHHAELLHIEMIYKNPHDGLEARCGYFWGLRELPEGMSEIPDEYKDAYPIEPPFITVACTLDRNWTPKGTTNYLIGDVDSIKLLKPEPVRIKEIKNKEIIEMRYGGESESSFITVLGYFLNFIESEIEIAHALDENKVPKEREKYLTEKIIFTRVLKPVES